MVVKDLILNSEWHKFLRERVPLINKVETRIYYTPPPHVLPNTIDDVLEYLFNRLIFKNYGKIKW